MSFLQFSSFKFRSDFSIMLSFCQDILNFSNGYILDDGCEMLANTVTSPRGFHKCMEFHQFVTKIRRSVSFARAKYWKNDAEFPVSSSLPEVDVSNLIETRDFSTPQCMSFCHELHLNSSSQSPNSCHCCPRSIDSSVLEVEFLDVFLKFLIHEDVSNLSPELIPNFSKFLNIDENLIKYLFGESIEFNVIDHFQSLLIGEPNLDRISNALFFLIYFLIPLLYRNRIHLDTKALVILLRIKFLPIISNFQFSEENSDCILDISKSCRESVLNLLDTCSKLLEKI
ncbi:hypothetical protein GEMRC1_011837 [Eukaryota sp. GEM-RC1]